ncbi:MAG: c-type cytochrome [Prolixibacteraceae bacterium]|jgi:mono/diheme cytochrome c family protein|nr:c-type cytochrome [Prolixibacteraceae bacterium]
MKRIFVLLYLLSLFVFASSAQEWIVPAENGAKLSPFAFTDSTRKAGSDLYNLNCKSCHGDPGKNNPVKLVPPPPDPASEKMQKNSDGAFFYKVAEGRGLMPSFKNTLSAADTWKIISYFRGFNDKYVQEVAKKPAPGVSLEQAIMMLTWENEKKQVKVEVTSLKEGTRQPVAGAELKLFAKRYFGNLQVGEARSTDSQGIALFNFPETLPGDSTGMVQILVKPTDENAFGEVNTMASMKIGIPTYRPPLNEQRALWNVNRKTPIWLLSTYIFSVLAVWALIVYVMLQLRLLFKSGEENNPE